VKRDIKNPGQVNKLTAALLEIAFLTFLLPLRLPTFDHAL
jgi:hypothetical protein